MHVVGTASITFYSLNNKLKMKPQEKIRINFCLKEKASIENVIKQTNLVEVQSKAPCRLIDLAKKRLPKVLEKLGEGDPKSPEAGKLPRIYQVELKPDASVEKTLEALRENKLVEFAAQDQVYEMHFQEDGPNDPEFNFPFIEYGQMHGLRYINTKCAWLRSKGDGVRVALIDTGVDSNQPDLANQLDFGVNVGDNGNSPDDIHGHGTSVAGIIAAEGDNETHIVGVAPNARIGSINAANYDFKFETVAIIAAFQVARDTNTRIVNCSFGPPVGSDNEYVLDPTLEAAIELMYDEGHILVFSAGNNGSLVPPSHPGVLDKVLCVGGLDIPPPSTDNPDPEATPYGNTNYGSAVDLSAPATNIRTLRGLSQWTISREGTSYAAGFVSGAIALLLDKAPDLSFENVRYLLRKSGQGLSGEPLIGPGLDVCNLMKPAPSMANRHSVISSGSSNFAVTQDGGIRRFYWDSSWTSELLPTWGAPVVPGSIESDGQGKIYVVNEDGNMATIYEDENGSLKYAVINSTWGIVPGTLRRAPARSGIFALNKWGDIVFIKWQNGQYVMSIIPTTGAPIIPHSIEISGSGKNLMGIKEDGKAFVTYDNGDTIAYASLNIPSDLEA